MDRTAKVISIIETWRAQRKEIYLARFGFGNAPSQFRSLTIAKDPRKWGKVVVIIHKLLRALGGPVLQITECETLQMKMGYRKHLGLLLLYHPPCCRTPSLLISPSATSEYKTYSTGRLELYFIVIGQILVSLSVLYLTSLLYPSEFGKNLPEHFRMLSCFPGPKECFNFLAHITVLAYFPDSPHLPDSLYYLIFYLILPGWLWRPHGWLVLGDFILLPNVFEQGPDQEFLPYIATTDPSQVIKEPMHIGVCSLDLVFVLGQL